MTDKEMADVLLDNANDVVCAILFARTRTELENPRFESVAVAGTWEPLEWMRTTKGDCKGKIVLRMVSQKMGGKPNNSHGMLLMLVCRKENLTGLCYAGDYGGYTWYYGNPPKKEKINGVASPFARVKEDALIIRVSKDLNELCLYVAKGQRALGQQVAMAMEIGGYNEQLKRLGEPFV